jgi:monoamine oxidase
MMTRRELIRRAGKAGGYSAAFVAMRSMGLLAEPPADSTPIDIPPNTGRGTKIAILGAGIAGLVAAYEMRKAGFDCTVLESTRQARRAELDHPTGGQGRVHRGNRSTMCV